MIRLMRFFALVILFGCLPTNLTFAADELVRSVDSIGITVSDMERAIAFYEGVLEFRKVSEREVAGDDYEHLLGVFGMRLRIVRMQLGDENIELMQFLAPRGRRIPEDSRSNDRWFQHIAIIVSDMDRAYARLREHHVAFASSEPQRLPDWNPNAGGIKAFYFRDPDDNTLEILQFPAGKGAAKWHASSHLFMGIDHTAIVVADTQASLAFYRDRLGLRIAGTSENFGTEQEHLNNVFGAHLQITALRAAAGPGVELLEYLAPRDGRPMPLGTRASDLWYWQINMFAANSAAAPAQSVAIAESGPGSAAESKVDRWREIQLHDPDGHASVIKYVR